MKSTARNFWKMIDDRNVTAIVMLCPENENNEVIMIFFVFIYCITLQEVCYQYWPSLPNEVVVGEYIINALNEKMCNGYIEQTFEIKHSNKVQVPF